MRAETDSRLKIFPREGGVVIENLLKILSCGYVIQDDVQRDASPFDAGGSSHDLGTDGDSRVLIQHFWV